MKTKEEIRATTGRIPKPANYKYGEKLKEWDASLTAGQEHALARFQTLLNDRIIVKLIDETPKGAIILTDAKPLIGGMRKARVLKCGPGKWIEGEWWKVPNAPPLRQDLVDDGVQAVKGDDWEINAAGYWQWYPGYRRPVAVHPGQTVYIGNWVDLEADGLALCQEGDIRGYVNESQTAQNGAHRKAQVSEGRNKRGTGGSARLSHAAKAL